MSRVRPALALLVLLAAWPSAARAQLPSPEEVTSAFFAALQRQDFAAAAAAMDTAALAELKETVTGLAALPGATEEEGFREMFGVSSVAELRALSGTTLYERMLRGTMQDEEVVEALEVMEMRPLGHVVEGDSLAHVVYRLRARYGAMDVDQVAVTPLRRRETGWKMLLNGSLAGIAAGMRPPGTPAERPR